MKPLENNSKFKLIFGNGLEEVGKIQFTKLIANIPYAITEPLYVKILNLEVPFVILLHGIDFYRNIVERETKWKYFVNSIYNVELIEEVNGSSFSPPTKVKSALVKLSLKLKRSQKEDFYFNLWNKKDRSLNNAILFSLVDTFNITKKEAKEKLLGFDIPELKLLNLSNQEFNILNEKLLDLFEE